MGCTISCPEITMSVFKKTSTSEIESDVKATLEQKLYLARESPEPIFDLSDCQLRQVPPGIYSLCKVFRKEYLYLNNNKLTKLEDGGHLQDLYLLKVLNINSNKFTQLNSNIKYLLNLTELNLQDNQIKNVPEAIQYLKSLRLLDVSKNKLIELTPCIGKLSNLRSLIINGNPGLNTLCPELCQAKNLTTIELDIDYFTYPPQDILSQGTVEIMMFLCNELNVSYNAPSPLDSPISSDIHSFSTIQSPFNKQPLHSWEEQEAAVIQQEKKIHEASMLQREIFLTKVLKDQSELDAEIFKVQEIKELERQRLIKAIQQDEKQIEFLINNFIQFENMKPEVVQQQIEYEQAEHDRLLEISRQNYTNIRKADILKAMETLIDEDCAYQTSKQNYDVYLDNIKQNMVVQELECSEKLEELLKAKDESHTVLVQELLEDQDIQKAIVASLLERVDAKSWSLNQEIAIVTSNLAKLCIIEQEKQKLHLAYNYNQLMDQRVQLLSMLDDLLEQQTKRRAQLVETLKEMEKEEANTTDFWLKNYQKLIDSAPRSLLDVGKNLDPQFANFLLQEGVIHCLPFLVKFLFSEESLLTITSENLKDNGVSLTSDREAVLRAIENYIAMKSKIPDNQPTTSAEPSAPTEINVTEQTYCAVVDSTADNSTTIASECVICMDAKCEVVFVPCGHMCCCHPCSERDVQNCPMCRGDIEKKIRVLIP